MIKYTLILFNFLGVFVFNMFFSDGIEIQHATPESIAPGQTKKVEITISKGNTSGFAKLELIMPAGFSAEALETKGASFTFSDQKAKLIWMSLPEEESFIVSYNLTAPNSMDGNNIIKGTFSYIKDNQRLDHIMEGKLITMGLAGETLAEETEDDTTDELAENLNTEPNNNEETIIETIENTEEELAGSIENIDEDIADTTEDIQNVEADIAPAFQGDELATLRSVENLSAGEYRVKVMIVNSNIEGFGKITEYVPEGMVVSNINSGEAIPTIENYGVKFVWFEVPSDNEFEVSYTLKSLSSDSNINDIEGTFSYIYENAPQELATISGEYVHDNAVEEVFADNTIDEEEEKSIDIEESIVEIDAVEEDVADNTSEVKATSVPNPETGVTYKVQIVAGHNTVGKSYFKKRHSFTSNFNIENHEGWVKYTTGQYGEYKKARDGREDISANYNFDGPFVTAYSEGERITVQEALMITNQKWYQ